MLRSARRRSTDLSRFTVHLDRRREAIVCVDTGRNEILRISLRLSVEEQDVSFDLSRAVPLEPNGKFANSYQRIYPYADAVAMLVDLAADEGALVMRNLPAYTLVRLRLPLTASTVQPELRVSSPSSTASRTVV